MNDTSITASYWTSFCAFIIGWCDGFFTLPNMVMVAAIIASLGTFVFGQYWQYRKDKRDQIALDEAIERRKQERRVD